MTQPHDIQRRHNKMGGFDCEFVKEPPSVIQTNCPICLLVLREPSQVTCCGKSYCRSCIESMKLRNNPCPCCQEGDFVDYPNKGLQQPLYGLQVYCTNKKEGCEWTGELRTLDKHRNLNPEQENVLEGCQFAEIKCAHCSESVQRKTLGHHQNELCSKRPFSCEYCHSYKSTYEDVTRNHWQVCNCYLIQCPNKCGVTSKRENLDSHLDNDCPLAIIQCDFHYAGCKTNVARKDMSAHISNDLTTHLTMLQQHKNQALVQEVEELKHKVVTLTQENATLKKAITASDNSIQWLSSIIGLFPKLFVIEDYKNHILDGNVWYSPPFYSHLHGYKLCFEVRQNRLHSEYMMVNAYLMRGEFDDNLHWPFLAQVTVELKIKLVANRYYSRNITFLGGPESERVITSGRSPNYCGFADFITFEYLERFIIENGCLHIRISKVELLK